MGPYPRVVVDLPFGGQEKPVGLGGAVPYQISKGDTRSKQQSERNQSLRRVIEVITDPRSRTKKGSLSVLV